MFQDQETRALKLPSLNARRVMSNRPQSDRIKSIVGQHKKYEAKLPSRVNGACQQMPGSSRKV